MKKFKKLIPAFCAMLVSAAMLGTSTYAWFSVNKKVEAKGMSVTAQANTQYFVISTDTTFGTDIEKALTNAQITQAGTAGTGTVYPAAYGLNDTKGIENQWWTANVSKYGSTAADEIINVSAIEAVSGQVYTNSKYFVGYHFYVGLNAKSGDFASEKLQIKAVNETGVAKIAAVQLVPYTDTTKGTPEFLQIEGATAGANGGVETQNSYELSATSKKYVEVIVYLYVDGNNALVKDTATGTDLQGTAAVKVAAATEKLN